jgi:hypothetical protein
MTDISLEPEQAQLLERLVEATRSRPRSDREEFMVFRVMGGDQLQGNGLVLKVLMQDVQTLVDVGLLAITSYHTTGHGFNCFVTPPGFTFYEDLRRMSGTAPEQLESDVIRYLEADEFQAAYPTAFARWREAADLLWGADSERELSTIGHKCREAVQEFATALVEADEVGDANSDKTKTRDRLSAVLKARHEALAERHRALLDALFGYWVAAGDLIQRQEHAGQREGEELVWEDGRRVVFQTAVVMFEIDRALSGSRARTGGTG